MKLCQDRVDFQTLLKVDMRVCDRHQSTLQRKSAQDRHIGQPKWTEIIAMIKWIQISRLSMKNKLSPQSID